MHVGQYDIRILKSMGQGRLGEVFHAMSRGQGWFEKKVVIKRLWESVSANPGVMQRYAAAVQAYGQLDHPNLLEIHDFTRSPEGYHLLVMEHVDGVELRRILHTFRSAGRLLPVGLSLQIIAQVCSGLTGLHGSTGRGRDALGLVHRGVNPANIMVTPTGLVKLMDLGLDVTEEAASPWEPDLCYLAPEQLGADLVDVTADQFATGLILAEMLLGRPVYDAATPALLREQVISGAVQPSLELVGRSFPELHPVIEKALQVRAEDRYLDMAALGRAIEAVMPPAPRDIDLGTLVRLLSRGEPVAEVWGRALPSNGAIGERSGRWKAMASTSSPLQEETTMSAESGSTGGTQSQADALDEALPPEPLAMRMFVLRDSGGDDPSELPDTSAENADLPEAEALYDDGYALTQPMVRSFSTTIDDPSLPPDPTAMRGQPTQSAPASTPLRPADPDVDYWDNMQTVQVRAHDLEAAAVAAEAAANVHEAAFFAAPPEEAAPKRGSRGLLWVGLAAAAGLLLLGGAYMTGALGGGTVERVATASAPSASDAKARPIAQTQSRGAVAVPARPVPVGLAGLPLEAAPAPDEPAPPLDKHSSAPDADPVPVTVTGQADDGPAAEPPAAALRDVEPAVAAEAASAAPAAAEPPTPAVVQTTTSGSSATKSTPLSAPEGSAAAHAVQAPEVVAALPRQPPASPPTTEGGPDVAASAAAAPAYIQTAPEPAAPPIAAKGKVSFGLFPQPETVTIDGVEVGRYGRDVTELPVGRHTVVITTKEGETLRRSIVVSSGVVHRYSFDDTRALVERTK